MCEYSQFTKQLQVQRVYLRRMPGATDAKRAALYCLFRSEDWFGESAMLSNLGVAALLVTFYGYQHAAATRLCNEIDLHVDREQACGDYRAIVDDPSLHRDGLREAMAPHIMKC